MLRKTQTRVFPISRFLVNPFEKEIVITPELDKRIKTTSKKIHDDVMVENYDVIAIF